MTFINMIQKAYDSTACKASVWPKAMKSKDKWQQKRNICNTTDKKTAHLLQGKPSKSTF